MMSSERERKIKQRNSNESEQILKEYRSIEGHECALQKSEDALSMYLFEGPFVLLRRKVRQIFLISETVPKTKLFFRSSLRIGMEKRRHLRNFYYTIHPFSKFRFYWEILMAFNFLTLIIYLPVFGIYHEKSTYTQWNDILYGSFNVICVIDSVFNFFTGYVDKEAETVILNSREIFKNYFFGYFIIDAVAALPTNLIFVAFGKVFVHWSVMNRYVRVLRLGTATTYLQNFMDVINVDYEKRHIIIRMIFLAVFVEYSTFISFYDRLQLIIEQKVWDNIDNIVLKFTYFTARSVFMIKPYFYELKKGSWFGIIHQFILLQFGNLFNAYLIARVLAMYNKTRLVSRKQERLTRQIKEYARYKKLSDTTNETLLQFVDFKFGRNVYDEDLILSTLTPHLRDDLFFEYSQKLMEQVELFNDMPTTAIRRIATRLQKEIILPNDVIIQAGEEGSTMYFIIAGVVAVYTIYGKEVCHLTDGANFGEIALLMNETRTASIVATDFCEVLKLLRRDFQEAIEPFPEISERITNTARERFTSIKARPSLAH